MTLPELRDVINIAHQQIEQTLELIADIQTQFSNRQPTTHELASCGTYLHNLYAGFENILLRIMRYKNLAAPHSANWHAQLVDSFIRAQAGLPPIIAPDIADSLATFRSFRHLFLKNYATHLRWDQMRPLLADAPKTFRAFLRAVDEWVAGETE